MKMTTAEQRSAEQRYVDDCVCEICIDDTTTESVQYYTVKSKFTVSTLTCLDHLAVREDCECDVKQCVIKPRHLVFLLDSSDSFNKAEDVEKISWFNRSKTFVTDFLTEANFDKITAPTVVSVYHFSGIKKKVADYKPGSNGEVGSGLFHYKCEIDAKVWNGTSMKQKSDMIKTVEKCESLDGNGNLYLAIQDLSMKSFLDKSDAAMGKAPPGTKPEDWSTERILIVISDTDWDLNGLKDPNGKAADESSVINATRAAYNKIYTAMGSETPDARLNLPSFGLNRLSKPSAKSTLFDSANMENSLDGMKKKIFGDLNLN